MKGKLNNGNEEEEDNYDEFVNNPPSMEDDFNKSFDKDVSVRYEDRIFCNLEENNKRISCHPDPENNGNSENHERLDSNGRKNQQIQKEQRVKKKQMEQKMKEI